MSLLVFYIVLAISVSFICSLFEAVLLSVTPSYIAELQTSNARAAANLCALKENIDSPLSGILTLNTVAHTAGAAGAGAQATLVFGSEYLGLFSAFLTLAILILSEIIPKTLGANYWRTLAPSVSTGLKWMTFFCAPFIWLCVKVTMLFGKEQGGDYLRAELTAMATVGEKSGELTTSESNILKEMLKAQSVKARSIMTPRTVIQSLSQDTLLQEFVYWQGKRHFSRIPVYDKGQDDIVGYINRSEALMAEKYQPQSTLKSIRHNILAVPEHTRLILLFESLLKKHTQIAIVVDEYGGVLGLITMEDIIESLLGLEIVGKTDPAVDMQQLARKLGQRRQRGTVKKNRYKHDRN